MRVAVVGGGPAGLVTLKYLATAHEFVPGLKPIEAKLFEAEDKIGGTFRYRTYEDGEVCRQPWNVRMRMKHTALVRRNLQGSRFVIHLICLGMRQH